LFFKYDYDSVVDKSAFWALETLIEFLIPGLLGELGIITSFVDLELVIVF
jgi:hypothetical protein